ncbi:Hsp20/alpha crystallin family protein [Spartinivicinus ruber]|uniref:Hsp20/alpha crystallin family protein n=1 Tax=Spartinivicinus ruber TaxID=2683272 RepID=UPI0013D6D1CF|nr:Hsp20 family protein [Spartinivicinus ruber]
MFDLKNYKFLYLIISLCITIIGVLAFTTWRLSSELKTVEGNTPIASSDIIKPLPAPWPKDIDPWLDSWDPSGNFSALQKRMDEMMQVMLPDMSFFNMQGFGYSSSNPKIRMDETDTEYRVTVSVPEAQNIEVNTELKNNILTINGKVKQQESSQQSKLFYTSQFSQSVTLLEPVDSTNMRVDNKNHKVVITIQKT